MICQIFDILLFCLFIGPQSSKNAFFEIFCFVLPKNTENQIKCPKMLEITQKVVVICNLLVYRQIIDQIWLFYIFGALLWIFGQNDAENRKNQRFQFSAKILITLGVFIQFGSNLVCSIPMGVSKILMQEILIFAFLPVLPGFECEKWPFLAKIAFFYSAKDS